ncbi:P-loop containing nucleoside triphosphate hydrolase protein [Mycena albidolilacea]|uniref:P-loop containing nucleoside triphosphate hydrolase protein n=1 Tax=Mycena albidolilacea TaxID=1033008 RepID=A0AAD7EAD9_9AGAR|nr:P-loop containing nucleoside triphosphate hydrolase protein [Mycena albidolilacea]
MPRQSTLMDIRVTNIVQCLTLALTLLKELNDAFGPPFIQPIANTIESLISMAQIVKRNKDECARLMENIHPVLYAIISLHLKSETVQFLPPAMQDNIGMFMETLHKIYTFLEAQQDGNKLKHLFRHNEMQNLLEGCHAGLDQAAEVFNITTGPAIISEIDAIKETSQHMHEELLELIQTLSDASTTSDRSSPKIFHGRESEVENIMKVLSQESPRIAILGGGGMGKTSLARTVLHHPDTCTKFEDRFFVSAESASTSVELAALIGLHVGLNPGTDLTRAVVQCLSRKPSCLLILDNLETVWEPIQSRGGIEEFLALLTVVEHLALIITMRGAERPTKVHWTHPFLLPLQPLSAEAAQQTFMEITDNVYRKEEIEQILKFTDNMPLAVDLMAHLSDCEGLPNVLARWDTERTTMLSVGYDRKSNLDASIQLSLSSPRITSNSKELLGLLSILPDGLSDTELVQSKLPILNILSCKSLLLATSLAYQDSNRRLRSLMPVREHVQQFLPPSVALVQCLRKLFYGLLELYNKYNGEQLGLVMNQITQNLANFQEVLQRGLYGNASDLRDTIYSISTLSSFYRTTGRGALALIEYIQPTVPGLDDHHLKIQFMTQVLLSYKYYPTFDGKQIITEAISILEIVNNPLLAYKFYNAAAFYFHSFTLTKEH